MSNHDPTPRLEQNLVKPSTKYVSVLEGLVVCHRCEVGLCVCPSHLFLGTQVDLN
jgi:hypothetical protein